MGIIYKVIDSLQRKFYTHIQTHKNHVNSFKLLASSNLS